MKIIVKHQPEGTTEEFDTSEEFIVSAYDSSRQNIRLAPDRAIVSVQYLPYLGEIFIQTWTRDTWSRNRERCAEESVSA